MRSRKPSARKDAPRRPGRHPLTGGRVKFTTTLPEGYVALLREIGHGNASAGIVKLVDGFAHESETARMILRGEQPK